MNNAVRAVEILSDQTGRQAILRRVGAAHHFLFVLVSQNRHHRPEDLFAHDGHLIATVGKDGGFDPGAVVEVRALHALAAAQQARAFRNAALDVAHNVIAMAEAHQRTKICLWIVQVASADAHDARQDFLFKRRLKAGRYKDARAVGADLAGAVKIGHHGDIGGQIEIGIVENNQRRLPAQLHGDLFQGRSCCVGHHFFTAGDAAGKRDFIDAGVPGQQLAGDRAAARQYVENAVRHASFAVDLRQFQSGKRRHFARLKDHRVARCQRRRGFPQRNLNRVVPRADARDHTERLAARINERGVAQRDLLPLQRRDQTRVILQHVCAGDDIHAGGFAQRLAGIQGFQRSQLVVARAQNIHRAAKDARALHGGHRRPDFLAFTRRCDGAVDVSAARFMNLRQHFAISGVDRVKGVASRCGDISAINIEVLLCESGHGFSLSGMSVAS